ncbi:MAG: AAA family ATPase, partial [Microcoleus sp. T1-bin1]|nr:AAA family ATPase [Microcoleus sp. T1-bin1]
MIGEVRIENYKSIQKLKLELGRVTVLIGENGCGKSNILEAIALASAAADDKLDNEFLASRGIRVTEPQFMRSAFEKENLDKDITIDIKGNDENFSCILSN